MKFNLSLFPYQEKAFLSKKKYVVLGSGTGAGKTWLLAPWLVFQALTHNGQPILALGLTIKHLKRNLWNEYLLKFLRKEKPYFDVDNPEWDPDDEESPEYIDLADHDLVEGVDWILNKTDMTIHFPESGCTIYGAGMNEPDSFQGIHAIAIGADEIGRATVVAMDTIRQRINYKKERQLFGASTPYDWGPMKITLFDPWDEARRSGTLDQCNIEYIQVKSIDNPYYDKETYYSEKKTLPAWKFGMLYDGKYTKPAGVIYEDVEFVAPFPIPDHWYKTGGLDFGFNHPAGIIRIAQDPSDGVRYIYSALIRSGMTDDVIQEHLEAEPMAYYCDTAQAGTIATLASFGIDARKADKAPGSVEAGIRMIDREFRTRKLVVFSNLVELQEEILNYSYELDANGDPTEKVVKEHDNGLDAVRYNRYTQREGSANPSGMRVGPKRYTHNAMKNYRRRR